MAKPSNKSLTVFKRYHDTYKIDSERLKELYGDQKQATDHETTPKFFLKAEIAASWEETMSHSLQKDKLHLFSGYANGTDKIEVDLVRPTDVMRLTKTDFFDDFPNCTYWRTWNNIYD